jgi:hypothetical protein
VAAIRGRRSHPVPPITSGTNLVLEGVSARFLVRKAANPRRAAGFGGQSLQRPAQTVARCVGPAFQTRFDPQHLARKTVHSTGTRRLRSPAGPLSPAISPAVSMGHRCLWWDVRVDSPALGMIGVSYRHLAVSDNRCIVFEGLSGRCADTDPWMWSTISTCFDGLSGRCHIVQVQRIRCNVHGL